MNAKRIRRNCTRLLGHLLAVVLFAGLTGCDQAPTPPPFRTYEEPQPFEPPETAYTLNGDDEGSVD